MARFNGRRRGTKYGNVHTVYAGVRYDSKSEAKHAEYLDYMVETGEVRWWLRQVPVWLTPDDKYVMDFLVCLEDGTVCGHEVKGVETSTWLRKKKLWKKYGNFDLYVIRNGREAECISPECAP